jgi:hypothetical protein
MTMDMASDNYKDKTGVKFYTYNAKRESNDEKITWNYSPISSWTSISMTIGKNGENKDTTPKVKNIFFNVEKKTTTVLWEDGTKNIVKCTDNEEFLPENGVAMAFMNKIFGSRNAFKKVIAKGKFQGDFKDKKKDKDSFNLYAEDVLKRWKENTVIVTDTQNDIHMQNDYE